MQSISSYGVEINKQNLPICHTLKVYRQAVSYLIRAYAQARESLSNNAAIAAYNTEVIATNMMIYNRYYY